MGKNTIVSSGCGSTCRKGPLDSYFSQKPGDNAGKNDKKKIHDVAKDILRDHAVASFLL